ncbi:MAG: imidazole glycerol phosphate synthase subunit HisH, partial [bacterium]|nr:imidazole glycerol phosphate synthase subunit HisH [bacterium]
TASLAAAFTRLGVASTITEDRAAIDEAELLVLPGVGSFGAGIATLDRLNLRGALNERAGSDRPLLAVCLGMQLLAERSDETPGVRGLEIIHGTARRFPPEVTVPQMGWNEIQAPADARFLRSGCAYFANSYRLTEAPAGWRVATAHYAGPFIAAMERGATLACQFHPELSGWWGLRLLARWAGVEPAQNQSSPEGSASSC